MIRKPNGSIKIISMLAIFGVAALFALLSYFFLLQKETKKSSTSRITPTVTSTKKSVIEHPKEYVDDNLQFFYPDTLKLDIATGSAMSWKVKLADGSFMPNAMTITTQSKPFSTPTNVANDPNFSIDDQVGRVINGLDVMEYTIHCAYRCSRREDQFKVNDIYYQITFDVFPPGFSEQAELILQTFRIRKISPAPSTEPIACTQEAKLCTDGSYVSRSGPNCEFTACPR